ncbi:MAG: GNAT family N-acetyltransferase [Actinomycetota bacterium]|nr:GNAT family N-acetyltransferase [Actinomycetota bacterium]
MTALETERLLLRPWNPRDIDALASVFGHRAVWEFPFGRAFTREETERFLERQVQHWERHGFGLWAAELKAEGTLIGFVGLAVPTWLPAVLPAVEVGWRLQPDQWGRGLATEGGRASLRHGFDTLRLDRIISIFMPDNVASGRVMDKLGMRTFTTTEDPNLGVPLEVREITRSAWRAKENGPTT